MDISKVEDRRGALRQGSQWPDPQKEQLREEAQRYLTPGRGGAFCHCCLAINAAVKESAVIVHGYGTNMSGG